MPDRMNRLEDDREQKYPQQAPGSMLSELPQFRLWLFLQSAQVPFIRISFSATVKPSGS